MTVGLTPISIGPVAAEILHHDGDVEVVAVFERCVYVAAPGGHVCIGVEALGSGPLNILLALDGGVSAPLPKWSRLGVTREAKGTIANGVIGIGDDFSLSPLAAARWQPPPWSATSRTSLGRSLQLIRSLAAPMCPSEGLSRLVLMPSATPLDRTAQAAAELVRTLAVALPAALRSGTPNGDLMRAATLLIGLGPGLTPSGDDLLGGVFLASTALQCVSLREALWQAIEPEIGLLTVDVSGAHLAAAADGLGAASVHAAINAILAGTDATLPGHLAALAAIGHSSGFDTLAGVVLTLEAGLDAGIILAR